MAANTGRAVDNVSPKGVKLSNRPVNAVTAKLNPIEKVILSIASSVVRLGNRVSVRQ